MQAWDTVIVGGSVAGLRAAIAAADGGSSVTVLSPSHPSSTCDDSIVSGISASVGEINSSTHSMDTQRIGASLCENDIVTSTTGSAVAIVAELERWGLNLRRLRTGMPHLGQLPGQSNPRTASTGDSTLRETRQILEEQCIKRNIPRRGDIEVLDLVIHRGKACGLVALDTQTGEIFGIQSKSIILAGSGFQSAWNGDRFAMGTAGALALRAGISLANLEFNSMHPLTVADTDYAIPLDVLGSGGEVLGSDGQPMSTEDGPDSLALSIVRGGGASLDLTNVSREDMPWFGTITEILSSRCGVDATMQLIPLMPRTNSTIGGIPTNNQGQVIRSDWNTILHGLFAAGDAACSGLHGASLNSGDQLLGALASGKISGEYAAEYAAKAKHSASSEISVAITNAHHAHDAMLSGSEDESVQASAVRSSLANTMRTHMGAERDASGLSLAASSIAKLQNLPLMISDSNPVMNTELVDTIRTQNLLAVSAAAVSAAISREETRGNHIRTDFPETSDSPSHSLSHEDGTTSNLSMRS